MGRHAVSCCLVISLVATNACFPRDANAQTVRGVVLGPGVSKLKTLPQNWTDTEANWFYDVAQGSKLLPYKWFLSLEQPDSGKLFNDPDHIRRIGYIPRSPKQDNPDGLPIGFVRDGKHVGLTCAACHTLQIEFAGFSFACGRSSSLG